MEVRLVRRHIVHGFDFGALLEYLAVVHVIVDVVEVGVVVVRLRPNQHRPAFAWHAQVDVPQTVVHFVLGRLLRF